MAKKTYGQIYKTYKYTDFTIIKYHYDTYTKIKAEVTVFLAK